MYNTFYNAISNGKQRRIVIKKRDHSDPVIKNYKCMYICSKSNTSFLKYILKN